jgi:hypothetical protein
MRRRPQAQAAGVGGLEQHAFASGPGRLQKLRHLLRTQDAGQRLGPFAEGQHGHEIGASQRRAVEEAQGADGLIELAPGRLLLQQVPLIGAHLVGAEYVGRLSEEAGEAHHVCDVAFDGAWRVVAQLQIIDQALP